MVEIGLDVLNLREMKKHQGKLPTLFSQNFSEKDYQKSIAYTRAKTQFGWIKAIFDVGLLWFLILSGGFAWIELQLAGFFPEKNLLYKISYPLTIGALFYVLHVPFSIYHQFVLEEKFGFNRMKPGLYFLDQVKTIFLSLLLGMPLLALIFKIVDWMGTWWWLGAWGAVMAFQLLTAALFPVLLAPLFYKFTPLDGGELKTKITELAKKIRFKMAGIFTIDGSKRSAHSNAFFAGIGKTRRIVLFDTLVQNLSTSEIVAVLAHEMGHNVKKHIIKGMLMSAVLSLGGFYLLYLCMSWLPFFQTFGVATPNIAIGLVLFGLVSSVFTFPFNPVFKWYSRKNEYEADQFSVETTHDPESMKSSLIKLSKDNLSNLTPHPWYSFYHYSHPTTSERVEAILAYETSLNKGNKNSLTRSSYREPTSIGLASESPQN